MQTLKNILAQASNFFTKQNTIPPTSNQTIAKRNGIEVCTSKDTETYRDFFEDMPPMDYYLLSAHLFMP